MSKKSTVLTIILFCLLLCSCGTKQTTEQTTEPQVKQSEAQEEPAEKVYKLDNIKMPDADKALEELYPEYGERYILAEGLACDKIYRMVEAYPETGNYDVVNYNVQVLDSPYTEWVNYPVDIKTYVQETDFMVRDAYVDTDGKIKLLFESGDSNYIGQWSEDNGFSAKEIPVDIDWDEMFYHHMFDTWYDDEEEGVFFLNEETAHQYDENGVEQSMELAKAGGLILKIEKNLFSGKLYFMGASADTWSSSEDSFRVYTGGFSIWTTDCEEAVFSAQDCSGSKADVTNCSLSDTGSGNCVAFASESEGYVGNQMGIYQFSMADKSIKEVFSFEDAGMGTQTSSAIRRIDLSVGEKGTLLVMYECADGTEGFAKLAEQTAEDESEKQELELALMWDDSFLKKAVVDFNKQSDKYQIVIRVCSSGEMDDYRNRIQAELSAGEGPDIIERSVLDLKAGAEKGYLLELTEYSEAFQETLFPAVAQLGKVDGKYYGIPYEFNVQTLVADREVVGERQGWSLEELMQCMEQSGAKNAVAGMDGAFSYYYLGARTENPGFIDWENGVSHLNEGQGCELLEFVMRYSQTDGETGGSTYEQVADGESLTAVIYTLIPAMALSASDSLQGREVYIGFPTEDHSGGHCLTGSILEVNRNSADTEGALAFIEYLLSVEQQSYLADSMLYGSGISDYPVRNDTLTELFDAFRRNAKEQEGEENYGVSYLTSEQYDALWEVLENAKLYDNDTEIVLDMLLEEGGAYRAGTKTAQQVMDVINNRVQLYLDESK